MSLLYNSGRTLLFELKNVNMAHPSEAQIRRIYDGTELHLDTERVRRMRRKDIIPYRGEAEGIFISAYFKKPTTASAPTMRSSYVMGTLQFLIIFFSSLK